MKSLKDLVSDMDVGLTSQLMFCSEDGVKYVGQVTEVNSIYVSVSSNNRKRTATKIFYDDPKINGSKVRGYEVLRPIIQTPPRPKRQRRKNSLPIQSPKSESNPETFDKGIGPFSSLRDDIAEEEKTRLADERRRKKDEEDSYDHGILHRDY